MSDSSGEMEVGVITKSRPRDRIAGAARDLFRKYGIRGIGVDAIAEAAGTNKMTLYRHFGSKDDLIVHCMRAVAGEVDAWWEEIEARSPNDFKGQLRAWARGVAEKLDRDGRGCDLANAAVELTECDHPARRLIADFKRAQRDRLAKVCEKAGVADAALVADALALLVEGARASRQSIGPEGPSAKFIEICDLMIEGFAASPSLALLAH